MAVWRADPKRRGQFVAGHAGLQRWIFRLEIGRHQDEGVMVPVGVWRCAWPPIGVLFHRALAADKFLRLLAYRLFEIMPEEHFWVRARFAVFLQEIRKLGIDPDARKLGFDIGCA